MSKFKSILFIFSFYLIYLLVFFFILLFTVILIKKWYPKKKKTILYLENLPIENAGYQYRAKQWSAIFNCNDFKSKVFTSTKSKGQFENQIKHNFRYFLIRTSWIRFFQIIKSIKYNKIIVRRELLLYNNYGNLFMEKFLFSIHSSKNIILDFDDDIARSKNEGNKISKFGQLLLESNYKFTQTLALYSNFIVCSEYLKEVVLKVNSTANICIIPTCVENQSQTKIFNLQKQKTVIAWIGSNGNQKYLNEIIDDLNIINNKYQISLLVISGKKYQNNNAKFTIINKKWSLKTQYKDLLLGDIGIMPLSQNNYTEGKCGFKLLQYMSAGLVSVASRTTINSQIINNGENGYILNDWSDLVDIIKTKQAWQQIGTYATQTIRNNYTFEANKTKFIKFIA